MFSAYHKIKPDLTLSRVIFPNVSGEHLILHHFFTYARLFLIIKSALLKKMWDGIKKTFVMFKCFITFGESNSQKFIFFSF